MKRSAELFLFLILVLPLVSAVEINMKQQFAPGETLLASIEGNFLSSIKPSQVYFYSDRVSQPLLFDISRIQGKYYLYALLPNQEKDYLLVIKDVNYYEAGREYTENIIYNFTTKGNLTADFSVYPGFVASSQNFSITLESLSKNVEVSVEYLNTTRKIAILPGKKSKLSFTNLSSSFSFLKLNSGTTSYTLPIAILSADNTPSSSNKTFDLEKSESFRFSSKEYNFSVNSGKKSYFAIQLVNLGDSKISNISLSSSSSRISLSPNVIDLEESSSQEIEMSVLADDVGTFKAIITAESENISIQALLIINVLEEDAIIPLPSTEIQPNSCFSYNGIICSSTQTCSGTRISSLEGNCCIGACTEKKKDNSLGIIIGIVLLALTIALLFFLYKKSKSKKQNPEDILKSKQKKFEERMAPKEISGSLTRS